MCACDTCPCLPLTAQQQPSPPSKMQKTDSSNLTAWDDRSGWLPVCLRLTDQAWDDIMTLDGSIHMVFKRQTNWTRYEMTHSLGMWCKAWLQIIFGLFYRLPWQISGGSQVQWLHPRKYDTNCTLPSTGAAVGAVRGWYRVGRGLDPRL